MGIREAQETDLMRTLFYDIAIESVDIGSPDAF